MLTPLTLPPRLVARALDDLHTLAETARRLPEVEQRLIERIDALELTGREVVRLGESIETHVAEAVRAAERLDERGAQLLASADEVDRRLETVVEALPTIAAFEASAKALAETIQPLQGVADRLGRIADRLPGGASRRPGG